MKGSNRIRATETIISKNGILELDKQSKAFLICKKYVMNHIGLLFKLKRKRKEKTITKSELDDIKGIGNILKKDFLKNLKILKK